MLFCVIKNSLEKFWTIQKDRKNKTKGVLTTKDSHQQ